MIVFCAIGSGYLVQKLKILQSLGLRTLGTQSRHQRLVLSRIQVASELGERDISSNTKYELNDYNALTRFNFLAANPTKA